MALRTRRNTWLSPLPDTTSASPKSSTSLAPLLASFPGGVQFFRYSCRCNRCARGRHVRSYRLAEVHRLFLSRSHLPKRSCSCTCCGARGFFLAGPSRAAGQSFVLSTSLLSFTPSLSNPCPGRLARSPSLKIGSSLAPASFLRVALFSFAFWTQPFTQISPCGSSSPPPFSFAPQFLQSTCAVFSAAPLPASGSYGFLPRPSRI